MLKLTGITKRFGSLVANDSIDLEVHKGEIHALLGENGAGKSTLMNLLYGLYTPDEGIIEWKGERVQIRDPRHAISLGIGMVHQHFMLVPVFTVAENIVLGTEPRKQIRLGKKRSIPTAAIDMRKAIADVRKISEQYGLAVDPEAKVESISVGQQQRVEILKALYRGAELLILDEPTAVLTPQEVLELGEIMHSLVSQGKTIIIITHKLKEVRHLADRVSVIRRGRKVATVDDPRAKTVQELAALMVGRDVTLKVAKGPANPTEIVLQVEGLSAKNHRGVEAVRSVSLAVRKGEIVGIAGVDGNGQTELIECITGLRRSANGRVLLHGKELTGRRPRTIRDAGLGHIPEDRHARGLVLDFTVAENSVLGEQRQFSRFGFLDFTRMRERAAALIKHFDVRPPEPEYLARELSGGNQQKVIIGREVLRGPDFLIAAQPTRGLDVGAIEFIHKRLIAERDAGKAVLLVSLELDEVMALADRILVMYKGEVVAEMEASEATEEKLGLLMAGGAINA